MQTYLLIGNKQAAKEHEIPGVPKNILDFVAGKIDEVRLLKSIAKFGGNQGLTIRIENFNEATQEAQNALLKILEEPPQNIFFILLAKSELGILPTILSRSSLIRLKNNIVSKENYVSFLEMPFLKKSEVISKIKSKAEALDLIESEAGHLHFQATSQNNKSFPVENLKALEKTLDAIRANGNIYLQLLNLAVKTDKDRVAVCFLRNPTLCNLLMLHLVSLN